MEFAVRSPAPWIGQHTAEVLREAGYDEARIAAMFDTGAAYDAHPHLHHQTDAVSAQTQRS
jgi:hypothetical protein